MTFFANVYTVNLTDKRVWVTIYDLAKTTHLDYGWMDSMSYRSWSSGNYTFGGFFHVRGEVKSDATGSDPNVYDTSVEINPQAGDKAVPVTVKDAGGKVIFQQDVGTTDSVVTIMKGTDNYYWDHTGPKVGL